MTREPTGPTPVRSGPAPQCPPARELVPALLARLAGRAPGPLVVLDRTWPDALRRQARADVDQGIAARRLTKDDLVLFTSGSSGAPRAVVRTIESWQASLTPLTEITGIRSDVGSGPVWVPGPLTSSLFLYGALHAAWAGLDWTGGRPDSPRVQQATAAHLVPTQLVDVLDAGERGLLPHLRTVVVAGAHLASSLRGRATRQGLRVVEYYGAAELSFVGWRDDDGPFRPFPGAEVALGTAGELWVRSPYVARDYLRPEANAPWRQRDGWHTVGDLARPAATGWWLVGRGESVVTTGGHTVLVAEVEAALRGVPGVADVVVLGLPHERLGQVVSAVVHTTTPGDAELRLRLQHAARALPGPSRPRRWLRADALPVLPSGKVDRAALQITAETLPPL